MACRKLISIDKDSCQSNRGGINTTVYATNRSYLNIAAEKGDDDTETGYVTLSWKSDHTSADMVSLSFRKQSSGLTSEGTIDDTTGNNFVTSNLSLVFARQDVAKRLAIQALALQEDMAIIVKDANGEINFLGFDESVTATALAGDKGTAATDANNYSITLTDLSNELPYYVAETTLETLLG